MSGTYIPVLNQLSKPYGKRKGQIYYIWVFLYVLPRVYWLPWSHMQPANRANVVSKRGNIVNVIPTSPIAPNSPAPFLNFSLVYREAFEGS